MRNLAHTVSFAAKRSFKKLSPNLVSSAEKFHSQECLLVVKYVVKNLDLALNFLMLMHCTTNKKEAVSLKILLYWTVTRNRIKVISCSWEQQVVQFYICWRWQNTLGRGSHCITSIPTLGKRLEGRKACNMLSPYQEAECLPAIISLLSGNG